MEPTQQIQTQAAGDPAKNGQAVASLVLGIVGILFSILFAIVGVVLGAVGIYLGLNGKKSEKRSLGTTGFYLNIAAVVIGILNMILGVVLLSMFGFNL